MDNRGRHSWLRIEGLGEAEHGQCEGGQTLQILNIRIWAQEKEYRLEKLKTKKDNNLREGKFTDNK